MKTLEKQQKEGHYSVYLSYNVEVEQDILQHLANNEDIVAKNAKNPEEFAPGKNLIKDVALNWAFVRPIANGYENFITNYQWTGYTSPLKWIVQTAINLRISPHLVLDALDAIVITFLYFNNSICNNIVIPSYVAQLLKKIPLQNLSDNLLGKSAAGYFLSSMWRSSLGVLGTGLKYMGIDEAQRRVINQENGRYNNRFIKFIADRIPFTNPFQQGRLTIGNIGRNIENNRNRIIQLLPPRVLNHRQIEELRILQNNIPNLEQQRPNLVFDAAKDAFGKNRVGEYPKGRTWSEYMTSWYLKKNKDDGGVTYADGFSGWFVDFFRFLDQLYSKNKPVFSIILYSSATIGGIGFYRVFCKKILKNKVILEIDIEKFEKLLKYGIVKYVNPNIRIDDNYGKEMEKYAKKTRTLKFDIPNQVYSNNNNVGSQIHFVLKNVLKNLPQNVFVQKVVYHGKEQNEYLQNLNDINNVVEEDKKKKKDIEKEKPGPYDMTDIIWSIDPKDKQKKKILTPSQLNSIEKEMVRYLQQHHKLYRYYNRENFFRQHLFDTVTKPIMKPTNISPMVSPYYTIQFMNETDTEALLFYFYRADVTWFEHIRTIRSENIYEVKFFIKKFVEKNLENILQDIPEGLRIVNITKPVVERKTTHKCPYYQLYPYDRKDECQASVNDLTLLDKKVIRFVEKKEKERTNQKRNGENGK